MDNLFLQRIGSEELLEATAERLQDALVILDELLMVGDPEPLEASYEYWAPRLAGVGPDALEILAVAVEETQVALNAGQPSHFNALLCYMLMDWAGGKLEQVTNQTLEPAEMERVGTFRAAFVNGWQYMLALHSDAGGALGEEFEGR